MGTDEIRALYDQEQRIESRSSGMRREVADPVIREIGLLRPHSVIVYSTLDTNSVEEIARREIDYFQGMGHTFEWKAFDHDKPPDLKDRLGELGFEVILDDPETILVLDLETAPAALFDLVPDVIQKVIDPEQMLDVLSVQSQVWERNYDWLADELGSTLRETPDQLSVYMAYVDGKPVSSAWVRLQPHTQFASLWGGTTLPEYRKRGLFTALMSIRVQEAKARGYPFVTVDASQMSRPILEKFGFRRIATAYECYWAGER